MAPRSAIFKPSLLVPMYYAHQMAYIFAVVGQHFLMKETHAKLVIDCRPSAFLPAAPKVLEKGVRQLRAASNHDVVLGQPM